MPEISRFFGIAIFMYFADHPPPHFHVRYNGREAKFDIQTLVLQEGKLPPRVYGMVVEWASVHQTELLENWERARQQQQLAPIQPLE